MEMWGEGWIVANGALELRSVSDTQGNCFPLLWEDSQPLWNYFDAT